MILEKRIDDLNIKIYEDRENMGLEAANDFIEYMEKLQKEKDIIRIIFAAAPSQNEFLKNIVASTKVNWSKVEAFHMDEYIGLADEAPQGFGNFLKERIFDKVNMKNINLLKSADNDISALCDRYERLLGEKPVDIVCLGIGENGHIAFNDPGVANFKDSKIVKKVILDRLCRQQQVNDGCFKTLDEVPETALTLTVPALLRADKLFCIVPGETKKIAVNRAIYGAIDETCPASILRTHKNCTLYLDKDSFGL